MSSRGPASPSLRLLAIAVGVFATLAVAVSDQTTLWGETAVLEVVNDIPTGAGWPLRLVMQLGTEWVALVVATAVTWATRQRGPAPGLAVLVSVIIAARLDNVLKDIIDRPRPPAVLAGLHVRESIDGFGFPSGHTTMAFALAASIHPVLPRAWRWLAWALAATVGVARMHVGVHWPVDVAGGAALGTAIGTTAWVVVTAFVARRRRAPAR